MLDHSASPPRLVLLDAARLQAVRDSVFLGEERFHLADQQLLREAEEARHAGPFAVTDKEHLAPSGDPHDYLSQGPYWWPNPDTTDGLPWVRRDGEVNPETEKHDRRPLGRLGAGVTTLALAYYLSDLEDFAEHASLLLRCWFLDEATRMNPHLEYGQGIPGHCTGRGIGIIDTVQLTRVVDAAGLLGASPAWSDSDQQGLERWFAAYLDWLLHSQHGQDECRQPNNHGTWYDVQVITYALFAGQPQAADEALQGRVLQRLEQQLEPDGRQPLELARTRALGYSVMNLLGFFDLADLARGRGVDLWDPATTAGSRLRQGVAWLVANGLDAPSWEYEQIQPFETRRWIPLLRRAALALDDEDLEGRLSGLADVDVQADRTQLLYPPASQVPAASG